MSPEQAVEFLNDYFENMSDVVAHNEGTVDKFIGDGMMVLFGATKEDPFQEEHAVRAALEMQQRLLTMTERLPKGDRPLQIGVGIHSGLAVVGRIGSRRKMDFTAIGDTVNVASRLESLTKELHADILLSEATYDALKHAVVVRPNGAVAIKGRVHPVGIYAVESMRKADFAKVQ